MAQALTGGYPSNYPNPFGSFSRAQTRAQAEEANPEWNLGMLGVPNLNTRPAMKPRLPVHPFSNFKPEIKVPEYNTPPDAEPMGPPRPSALEPPKVLKESLPAYDPMYQEEATKSYGIQRKDIDDRYDKGISALSDLAKQYSQSQGSSFGGLMANQQAIASINGLVPAIAKGEMDRADRVGALPFMSAVNEATKTGGENRRKAQQSIFNQNQPSALANLELMKQQTEQAKQHGALFAKQTENYSTKEESKQAALEQHGREIGAKAYQYYIDKGKTPDEALEYANIQTALALGKKVNPGKPAVPAIDGGWFRPSKPAIPAVPATFGENNSTSVQDYKIIQR